MTILNQSDLVLINKNGKSQLFPSSSLNSGMKYQAQDKTVWIVKKNYLDWVVIEYIASKLYQRIIGDKFIADSALVKDGDNVYFASKAFKKFVDLGKDQHHYTNNFIFKNHNYLKSVLATIILEEGDSHRHHHTIPNLNYAIIQTGNRKHVTRFDFDDSLKSFFFDRIINPIHQSGESSESIHDYSYNPKGYRLIGFDIGYKNLYSKVHSDFINPHELLKNMRKVSNINIEEFKPIINDAVQEIKTAIGNEQFHNVFNHQKIEESIVSANKEGIIEWLTSLFSHDHIEKDVQNVVDYIHSWFAKKFTDFVKLQTCLSIEIAAMDGAPNIINEQEKDFITGDLECMLHNSFIETKKESLYPVCQTFSNHPNEEQNPTVDMIAELCKSHHTDEL